MIEVIEDEKDARWSAAVGGRAQVGDRRCLPGQANRKPYRSAQVEVKLKELGQLERLVLKKRKSLEDAGSRVVCCVRAVKAKVRANRELWKQEDVGFQETS